ncbi:MULTISPECIES: class I adenylate-forming enzyme family protein [Burkholderia]|uniref:AMP-binding protein n=1 Tax=Burkholderia aenigmatica TaxID=2015348 RepID=A0ABY6XZQ7_9BURK|nr:MULTISPECIES: AMP-binding protein [Burkholderia]VWD05415.1 putative AMP-binding protein [Burkholderia aenigmatica]VWD08849.1 putative AMP-binding protein [Burkholderia aenigmatica]
MQLSDYFDAAVSRSPAGEAFVDGDGTVRINFTEAQRLVHAVAHALNADDALRAGAHIAIYAPNDYRISVLQIAVNRAGMVWVSVHTRNAVETNIAVLDYADCDLVFFHSSYESLVPALQAGLPRVKKFVCIDRASDHGEDLVDWIDACRDVVKPEPAPDQDRPAVLQPTGGTTGPSKGALHTNRSLEMSLISVFDALGMDHTTRVLAVAPLTHAACYVTLAATVRGGATVVLPSFDVDQVLETIARERITHLFLPPTIVYALLSATALDRTDVSSLRCIAVGAAPIAPEKLKEAVRRFGPLIHEVYGQSECLFPVVAKRPSDYLLPSGEFDDDVLRSAGRPVPFARVEIMDDAGNCVGPGERGEIVVRSAMVMSGYYKRPDDTAVISEFGWHHTTDIGIRDARGFITIVDRKKDMIVSGGFNIFPAEIEAAINAHPAVLDCAVFGVPDEKWGEAVKAVVQLKPGQQVTEEQIIDLCKQTLGSVKAPKSVEFWDDLPRSAVGKVLKRDIRMRFWEGRWRSV